MNYIMNIADEGSRGCILEVDLDYPDHLHDLHNMYPLAAEHVTTSLQFLSPYNTGTVVNSKQRKLIPNLSRKEKYIVHFSALKFYLIQGLVLTRVRKVLVFDQAAWMGPFLDKCVYNRQRATSEFHKDFWKYMMNSCFGKTMENLRLRQRIDIINEKEKALRLIAKPTFKRAVIFDRRLAAIERFKTRQILNKPIYLGLTILDISKVFMADFHYNWIIPRFPVYRLLFTDTDSFAYYVEDADVYEEMRNSKEHFDFSNYPQSSPYFDLSNKKQLGKMKDEMAGEAIEEFIGLRPKVYSIQAASQRKQAAKGIQRREASRITHQQYKECLLNKSRLTTQVTRIENDKHVLTTRTDLKLALCPFDDKRYVCADGVSTLAYGHYSLSGVYFFKLIVNLLKMALFISLKFSSSFSFR